MYKKRIFFSLILMFSCTYNTLCIPQMYFGKKAYQLKKIDEMSVDVVMRTIIKRQRIYKTIRYALYTVIASLVAKNGYTWWHAKQEVCIDSDLLTQLSEKITKIQETTDYIRTSQLDTVGTSALPVASGSFIGRTISSIKGMFGKVKKSDYVKYMHKRLNIATIAGNVGELFCANWLLQREFNLFKPFMWIGKQVDHTIMPTVEQIFFTPNVPNFINRATHLRSQIYQLRKLFYTLQTKQQYMPETTAAEITDAYVLLSDTVDNTPQAIVPVLWPGYFEQCTAIWQLFIHDIEIVIGFCRVSAEQHEKKNLIVAQQLIQIADGLKVLINQYADQLSDGMNQLSQHTECSCDLLASFNACVHQVEMELTTATILCEY